MIRAGIGSLSLIFLIYILLNFSIECGNAGNSPGCDSCTPKYVDKCSNEQVGDYYNISYCCCNNKIFCFLPIYAKNYAVKGGPDDMGAISFVIYDDNNDNFTSIMISNSTDPYDRDYRTLKKNLRQIVTHILPGSPLEPYNKTIDGNKNVTIMEEKGIHDEMAFAAIYYPTPKKEVCITTCLNKDYFYKLIETLKIRDLACD